MKICFRLFLAIFFSFSKCLNIKIFISFYLHFVEIENSYAKKKARIEIKRNENFSRENFLLFRMKRETIFVETFSSHLMIQHKNCFCFRFECFQLKVSEKKKNAFMTIGAELEKYCSVAVSFVVKLCKI